MSRSVVRVLDEEIAGDRLRRVDHVLLHDTAAHPPPRPLNGDQYLANGSKSRFALAIWRQLILRRYDMVLFDHIGLARSMAVLPVGLCLPPFSAFIYGLELESGRSGERKRTLAHSHRLLAVSRHTTRILSIAQPSATDRVHLVRLCPDPERVSRWQDPAATTTVTPRRCAALIVGRMDSDELGKGHDSVIEAWPSVCRELRDAQLWVVGRGDDVDRLRTKAEGLVERTAIRFFGRVTDLELHNLYRTASVFVMPSRQEGFGLVYTEAMLHGLPCIGSRADAAGEVIVDGVTGLLVPYGDSRAIADAVVALLKDPNRSQAMGEAGRERVRIEFTYELFKESLLEGLDLHL